MIKLDTIDSKILVELDRDSRQPLSKIAKKLRQGRDRIEYRVNRLVREGLITKFEVVVDLYKLGYNYYKSYFKLESNGPRISELLGYLHKNDSVYWYSRCDGEWDLIVVMVARAPDEFYQSHLDLLSEFNDIVLNFNAYTSVGVSIFSRHFGLKSERNKFACKNQYYDLSYDQLDLNILNALSDNSRSSLTEVAAKAGCSPNIAAYRIDKMEKSGIIVGYRLDINLEKIDMVLFKSQLFLKSYDLGLRRDFLRYCDAHPNIIYYIKQIGDCNIEIELELRDYQEYYSIIEEIRAKFSKLIRNFNTILVRDSIRFPVPRVIAKGLTTNGSSEIATAGADSDSDAIDP